MRAMISVSNLGNFGGTIVKLKLRTKKKGGTVRESQHVQWSGTTGKNKQVLDSMRTQHDGTPSNTRRTYLRNVLLRVRFGFQLVLGEVLSLRRISVGRGIAAGECRHGVTAHLDRHLSWPVRVSITDPLAKAVAQASIGLVHAENRPLGTPRGGGR